MILSKQLGVFLNFVHNRFKQCVNAAFAEGGYDITAEQFLVLDTLWDEGVLTQQQVADIMLKDKNSIVKLIDGLEDRKLVKRMSNPNDRRQNLISVTDEAERIKAEVTEIALSAVSGITDGISCEELSIFVKVLDGMASNMDKDVNLLALAGKYPSKPKN